MADDKNWTLAVGERRGGKDLPFEKPAKGPLEQFKEDVKMVQETKDAAEELAGTKELKKELVQTKTELEQQRIEAFNKELIEIRTELKKALEQRDTPAIKELEHRLEETKEEYHKEQLQSLREDLTELRNSKDKGTGDIAEGIKRIKEASKELGLTSVVNETPPDIVLQLKKMDFALQIQLEEMRDERDRRDKAWQLEVKKWDEEREIRREEARGKYGAEKERTDLIRSAIDRGAKIIGRAVTEGEEGSPNQPISYHIEAEEGEMGEFSCPKCSSAVSIVPDTTAAVCAKCGFRAKVSRKAKSGTEG